MKAAVDVIDRTPQRTCRVRLEFAMVATLKGERNAVAERPQNISGPWSQRDHDMARRNLAIGQHHAPAIAVGHDRLDVRLPDIAARASEHPRIGLDHRARRVDRGGLRVQQAHFVDRHDIRLERGDRLAVEQFAGDAVFGQAGPAPASPTRPHRSRHALSQPVSRMRCPASAFTIHSRCSFADAPINPCRAVARGLKRDAAELARKRATHPAF